MVCVDDTFSIPLYLFRSQITQHEYYFFFFFAFERREKITMATRKRGNENAKRIKEAMQTEVNEDKNTKNEEKKNSARRKTIRIF